jgi:AcrR family transcriptional regulator
VASSGATDAVRAADPRTRDRDATAGRILGAARDLLLEEGSRAVGINAVARRAGCDKQLIYRYFGGLDCLIEAVGGELAAWWTERLGGLDVASPPASYAELIEDLAARLLDVLRREPAARPLLLWELTDRSEPARRVAEARSRALGAWVQRARGDLVAPPGRDAPAINALVIGALSHAVLLAGTAGQMAGMPLRDDADWERLEAAVRRLVRAVYQGT